MIDEDVLRRGIRQRLQRIIAGFRATPGELTRAVSYLETDSGVSYVTSRPVMVKGADDVERISHWEDGSIRARDTPIPGATTIRGADVADAIERDLDAIVDTTARDIELAAEYFIDDNAARMRALAEPVLAEAFGISGRTAGGEMLLRYAPYPGRMRELARAIGAASIAGLSLPPDSDDPKRSLDVAEIARWAQGGLRKLSTEVTPERVIGDDGKPTTKDMDLADRFLYLAKQSAFLAQPSVAHPEESAHHWSISSIGLAWLYVAANAPHLVAHSEIGKRRSRAGNAIAALGSASADLRKAIEEHLAATRKACGLPLTVEELATIGEEGGRYALDERLAKHIEGLRMEDDAAAENASSIIRQKSDEAAQALSEPSTRWMDPRLVCRALAFTLWDGDVAPRFKRALERGDSAGLPMPVLTNLVAISRRGAQHTMLIDGGAEILDHKGNRVGKLALAPSVEEKHVSLAALGNLTTQRIVRHLLWEGYQRKWLDGEPEPGRIILEGGYPALVVALGMKGNKAADEVKASLATLASIHIDSPTGEGQVFAMHHHRAHTGQPARLEMVLLGPFAPDYIARQLQGNRTSSDKWLVPIPLPKLLPPMVGRDRDHAPQAHLQVLALRELRIHAEEMAETGSVEIRERRWFGLADEAGVLRRNIPTILDAYPRGDTKGRPAFLERPGEWRFSLAASYEAERRTILDGANRQMAGRASGKRAAAKRRNGGTNKKPKGVLPP